MGQEVEVKYLIREDGTDYINSNFFMLYTSVESLRKDVVSRGKTIRQGYMPIENGIELAALLGMEIGFKPSEARLRYKAGKAFFTLKGEGGLSRNEAETEILKDLFNDLWHLTEGRRVEKVRLERPFDGHMLEMDVYTDRDLIVAEVEMPGIEEAKQLLPIGKDVTEDRRYKNKNLAK